MIAPLDFTEHSVQILDQRALPGKTVVMECTEWTQVRDAIKTLAVRGAPLIGIATLGALWLACLKPDNSLEEVCLALEAARPTAVNLFKATAMFRQALSGKNIMEPAQALALAQTLLFHEQECCRRMGHWGAQHIGFNKPLKIITHCNTGTLATGGMGTALGVIRTLAQKTAVKVYVDETRPLGQGARLTMWELQQDGIDCVLLPDSASAWVIKQQGIDLAITGADRIAANGDSANKIGTYNLALACQENSIPFYIAAPFTTVDASTEDGSKIPIEERPAEEITESLTWFGNTATLPGLNYAFDVTPARLISGFFTDRGRFLPPYNFGENDADF